MLIKLWKAKDNLEREENSCSKRNSRQTITNSKREQK